MFKGFDVVVTYVSGYLEYVRDDVTAEEASLAYKHYVSPTITHAQRLGLVKRVVLKYAGHLVREWKWKTEEEEMLERLSQTIEETNAKADEAIKAVNDLLGRKEGDLSCSRASS